MEHMNQGRINRKEQEENKEVAISKGGNYERLYYFKNRWLWKAANLEKGNEEIKILPLVGSCKGKMVSIQDDMAERSIWKMIYILKRQQWKVITQFLWKVETFTINRNHFKHSMITYQSSLYESNIQSVILHQYIKSPNQRKSFNYHSPIYQFIKSKKSIINWE